MKKVKYVNHLNDEIKAIRTAVFMEEQGFENEFDDTDNIATHVLIYVDDKPVGTGRLYDSEIDKNVGIIGRVAVLKECRGQHLGEDIIRALEDKAREQGLKGIELSAQCRVESFYKKLGYTSFGEIHLDEGCEHIMMKKEIS